MKEEWRDIPGYEGKYQVSDLGRVRSLDRSHETRNQWGPYIRHVKGCVLAPGFSRGYLIVNLSPKGTVAVHLLVARTFVPGYAPGFEANHADGVKTNNVPGNLEWLSKSGNQQHAVILGLKKQARRVKDPATGITYPSITQAAKAMRCRRQTAAKFATEQ